MAKTRENSSMKTENSSPKTTTKARTAAKAPTHEDIALRAYHLYLERNGAPGDPLEDWVRAESQLKQVTAKPGHNLGPKLVAA